jgi:triosephosphate isomerase
MTAPIFAANWKMHLGPTGARAFAEAFIARYRPRGDRELWFFPSAVALTPLVTALNGRLDAVVGAQNIHWEPKGAFTGELSVPMAVEAGARATLIGHSERRHVFGESDEATGRKVRAALAGGLAPMLCVGEKIQEREAGETWAVVERQLRVLNDLTPAELAKVVIAYEPVWAIGTGKTATPRDAAEVHAAIRRRLRDLTAPLDTIRILYGGSVKPDNILELIREPEIDGVLVGGASLEPAAWAQMAQVSID